MKTEKQIAKEVIEMLQKYPGKYHGICLILIELGYTIGFSTGGIKGPLPKLYKYLSNRVNYNWNLGVSRRVKGNHDGWYWKPYQSTPRIKILKQVYKIK